MEPSQTGLNVFTPQMGDVYTMMAVCGLAFVTLVFLAFRLNKIDNPDPRKKVLLPMLAYFMALLALMGFLGSFWSVFKYPTVEITQQNFLVGDETYPIPRSHEVRIESYAGTGLNNSSRVLLIQTKDRRTWAFPDDRYPITDMLRLLKRDQ
ncbi:hypothetical protein [Lewinella sp. 4G2]|uniref:hypothetical protein n=1 Tax=Lewinella sp. 4G2 TaxID=1803372 RepID=UPI0007B49D2B|nr:hypothetical protein [Lewinella sp. 4G2]OAV44806.1 hypothetical protein A3850_010035 [Lewinella sp. 4G2]